MDSKIHAENLIEAREILELSAVKWAAERRTQEDLHNIKAAQIAFCEQIIDGEDAIGEDLLFHLAVVSASKNNVLKSLFMKIFSDLSELLNETKGRDTREFFHAIDEHDTIIKHITTQNKEAAVEIMRQHLKKWRK
ncbi:MAG: FCD domain-containing protein [Bacteroidia bacterium]